MAERLELIELSNGKFCIRRRVFWWWEYYLPGNIGPFGNWVNRHNALFLYTQMGGDDADELYEALTAKPVDVLANHHV